MDATSAKHHKYLGVVSTCPCPIAAVVVVVGQENGSMPARRDASRLRRLTLLLLAVWGGHDMLHRTTYRTHLFAM